MSGRSEEAIAVAVTGVRDEGPVRDTLAALAACERGGALHVVISLSPGGLAATSGQRRAWRDLLRGSGPRGEDDEVTVDVLPPLPGMTEAERRDWAMRRALERAPLAVCIEAGELPERDALRWFIFGRDALLRRGTVDVVAAMSRTLGGPESFNDWFRGRLREMVDHAGLVNRFLVGPWTPPGAFATDREGWERVRPAMDAGLEADVFGLPAIAAAHGVRCAWPVVSRSRRFSPAGSWWPFMASGECWLAAAAFEPAHDEAAILELAAAAAAPSPERSPGYHAVMAMLHNRLRPDLYVEIGVFQGSTLLLATGRGIGVDPAPRVPDEVLAAHPNLEIYAETSDAFYARADLAEVLGRSVDLTFIDGLHHFDQALRDFINAERWASRDGAIALHDVLPMSQSAATFPMRQGAWTGDVWRIVECLGRHRPDLRCLLLDSPPSGLLVVSGLDPESTVLRERYEEIVGALPFDESEEYVAALRMYQATTALTALTGSPEDALPSR